VIQCCATRSSTVSYRLDIRNNANSGQFMLSEPLNFENRRMGTRLRRVADLYPVNTELEEDSPTSCSAERLSRGKNHCQHRAANHSLILLAHLFRYGTIWDLCTTTCVTAEQNQASHQCAPLSS
jgi:hypothetical protein